MKFPASVQSIVLISPIIPFHSTEVKVQPLPPRWIVKLAFGNDWMKWFLVRYRRRSTILSMTGIDINNTSISDETRSFVEDSVDTLLPAAIRCPGLMNDINNLNHNVPLTEARKIQVPIYFAACNNETTTPIYTNNIDCLLETNSRISIKLFNDSKHLLLDQGRALREDIFAFITHK